MQPKGGTVKQTDLYKLVREMKEGKKKVLKLRNKRNIIGTTLFSNNANLNKTHKKVMTETVND